MEEKAPPFVRSMCRHFMNGFCKYGDACDFAHQRSELGIDCKKYAIRVAPVLRNEHVRYQVCRHFMRTGMCKFGAECVFAHGPEELSAWREGK